MNKLYDVVVIGGGSAGIAAALGAARNNASVLLVEREASLGGQGISAKVASYCGFYTRGEHPDLAIGGVGHEVLKKMEGLGMNVTPGPSAVTGNVSIKFDPEKMKVIFDDLLMNSSVDFVYHTNLIGVNRDNNKILSVVLADDQKQYTVEGKTFIDCSGNANLVNLAGLPTEWGDEDKNVQQSSLVMTLVNLPKRVFKLPEISEAIAKAKADGVGPLPVKKGMIVKDPTSTNGMCIIPSTTIKSLDGSELTKAEIHLRQQAMAMMTVINKYLEGCESVELVETGPNIGIREARRMIGDKRLTGSEILNGTKTNDSVARAAWSPEIHQEGTLKYLHISDNDYASIPLGILHSKDLENLWGAGRLVSCDHTGLGSLRVMGTSFGTGQAAGVAASIQAFTDEIKIEEVQAILRSQGALL